MRLSGQCFYFLKQNLQDLRVKIPKLDTRSLKWVTIVLLNMKSAKSGLIINLSIVTISSQYHIVFDYTFSTVIIITEADP